MFELARYLPYLINRTGAKLALAFGRELVRFGVTLQEWRVLAALAARDGQRLSDLATLTSIDVSSGSPESCHCQVVPGAGLKRFGPPPPWPALLLWAAPPWPALLLWAAPPWPALLAPPWPALLLC